MQSFLLKRLTKLININLRGSKAKKSHLSNFPFSFCLNLFQNTILPLVQWLGRDFWQWAIFSFFQWFWNFQWAISYHSQRLWWAILQVNGSMAHGPLPSHHCLSRLSASKLLRKALKIAMKACNNERIISSDLKWCIHLSRSLFSYSNRKLMHRWILLAEKWWLRMA